MGRRRAAALGLCKTAMTTPGQGVPASFAPGRKPSDAGGGEYGPPSVSMPPLQRTRSDVARSPATDAEAHALLPPHAQGQADSNAYLESLSLKEHIGWPRAPTGAPGTVAYSAPSAWLPPSLLAVTPASASSRHRAPSSSTQSVTLPVSSMSGLQTESAAGLDAPVPAAPTPAAESRTPQAPQAESPWGAPDAASQAYHCGFPAAADMVPARGAVSQPPSGGPWHEGRRQAPRPRPLVVTHEAPPWSYYTGPFPATPSAAGDSAAARELPAVPSYEHASPEHPEASWRRAMPPPALPPKDQCPALSSPASEAAFAQLSSSRESVRAPVTRNDEPPPLPPRHSPVDSVGLLSPHVDYFAHHAEESKQPQHFSPTSAGPPSPRIPVPSEADVSGPGDVSRFSVGPLRDERPHETGCSESREIPRVPPGASLAASAPPDTPQPSSSWAQHLPWPEEPRMPRVVGQKADMPHVSGSYPHDMHVPGPRQTDTPALSLDALSLALHNEVSSDTASQASRTDDASGLTRENTLRSGLSSDDEDDEAGPRTSDRLPDYTAVNREPPSLNPPRTVPFRAGITTAALYGEMLVVATHDKVRLLCVRAGADFSTQAREPSTEVVVAQPMEHHALLGGPPSVAPSSLRVTAMAFAAAVDVQGMPSAEGRFVWYGTVSGSLGELDTYTGHVSAVRADVHKAPIIVLKRVGRAMVCADEGGKVSVWVPPRQGALSLTQTAPQTARVAMPKPSYAAVLGDQLWVASVVLGGKVGAKKQLLVRSYNPLSDDRPFNTTAQPVSLPMTGGDGIGAVCGAAVLVDLPGRVFLGHESGHVSVWTTQGQCVEVQVLGEESIVAMAGVHRMLWIGTRSGRISVYAPSPPTWRTIKSWTAHRDAVRMLLVDVGSGDAVRRTLYMCSLGADNYVTMWDALLSDDWLDAQLSLATPHFSTYCSLRVLTMTYNLDAASPGDLFGVVGNMDVFQRVLRSSIVDGVGPDVIVFAFQELVDLEDKRLTAKRLLLGGKKRTNREIEEQRLPSDYRAWQDELNKYVRLVMPPEQPHVVLLSESLVGLYTCLFVKAELVERIRAPASYTVKTGLGGRYGNKGAIVSRFVVDDSSFCFLNCHLAAGQRHVRQRNADVADILQSVSTADPLHRDPAFAHGGDGSLVLDHEICILAGDLNYRLNLTRERAMALIDERRYEGLIAADQLQREMRENPSFRLLSFNEAPICFAPTYKFNRLSNDYDTSEKARVPAYCDRILYHGYLNDTVQCTSYKRWDATISDHRPVSATFVARIKSIDARRRAAVAEHKRAEFSRYCERVFEQFHRHACGYK